MYVTAEYQLIVNCCRRSFDDARSDLLPVEANLDWPRVVELARFHRVQGLVAATLRKYGAAIPHLVAQQLYGDSSDIAAQSLTAIAECRRLLAGFHTNNIPLLFLKGATLAQLAYCNPSLKSAIDIDVLIDPAQLNQAAQTLRDLGYLQMFPVDSAAGRTLEHWHFRSKESVWIKPGSHLHLDLHTRLVDNPALIPSIGINSPTQDVELGGGIVLPTLAPDEMFAYLCVHGASCAWFRLKWISDLAGLIARFESRDIDHLYGRSQDLGAGRAAAQALLLADHEFGALCNNTALRVKLLEDRANRHLLRAALRQLHGATGGVEGSKLFATARMHWTQVFLLPGARFMASEIARQIRMALLFRSEISKLKRARMLSGLPA